MQMQTVVVIGNGVNALGVLRALGPYYHTILFASDKQSPAARSRFADVRWVRATNQESIVEDMLALAREFSSPPCVILTEEKSVLHIARSVDRLSPHYQLNLPPLSMIEQMQDKDQFQQLAEKHQAPVPKTRIIRNKGDLNNITDLTFPCVFKPHEQDPEYGKRFRKAYKVFTIDDVQQLYQQIEPVLDTMVLQEWIEGDDSEIYFCIGYYNQHSEPVASFTGRKIRSWPVQVGGTACCTQAPEQAEILESICHAFYKSINYRGLIGMEFKRNSTTGEYLIIEPTVGRTDFQHEVSALNGHNILLALANDTFKIEPPYCHYTKTPIVWREDIADELSSLESGDRHFPAGSKVVSALFRWRDPAPFFLNIRDRIKRRFSR